MRTARAKGAQERSVVMRHALPNALLPVITISGVLLGFVLGGSVAVEQAFGVPGLGRALVTAIIERDIIVVQNLVLLYAVIFVLVNVAGRPQLRLARSRGSGTSRPRHAARCSASSAASPVTQLGCRRSAASSALLDRAGRAGRPAASRPRDPLEGRLPAHEQAAGRAVPSSAPTRSGRDTLSRVIYGARTSLFVAFSAVLLGTTVGSLWGVACGYLGGRFDLVSQRIMEVLQSFPDLILAMAISMAIGTGLPAVIVGDRDHPHPLRRAGDPLGGAQSCARCPSSRRARATGASQLRVMALHVLPQCVAPYLVLATTHLGVAIVIEAALGFLGVGVPPPTPTWGNMLADAITGARAAVVAGALPRPRDHRDRARVQPARRRDPRHARPEALARGAAPGDRRARERVADERRRRDPRSLRPGPARDRLRRARWSSSS